MSKIVFVLGAGASAHCGTPLMSNFLDMAQDLWRNGEVDEVAQDFKSVFDAVGFLREVHSKAKLDLKNIEVIFTAFEMGKLLGVLPGVKGKRNIDSLISSLKKVIGYTLEKTMILDSNDRGTNAPTSYYSFAGIIENLIQQGKECSIITFNYDLGLDYSLYKKRIVPDYGLDDITIRTNKYVSLLKLHGSLNWYNCKKCKKIMPYRGLENTQYTPRNEHCIIPVVSHLNKGIDCQTCKIPFETTPFIVPPTWNKTAFHGQIEQVWGKTAEALKDAESIFVLGYSLPTSDWFFNYLFALGLDMRTHIKGFYVYNRNHSVAERFQKILGQDIFPQRFFPYNIPFEDAVKQVAPEHTGKTIPQILNIRDTRSNGPTSFVSM